MTLTSAAASSDLVDLHGRGAVVAAAGDDDAFARWDPHADVRGWALGSSVAVIRCSSFRPPSLFAWGPQVGPLLDVLVASSVLAETPLSGVSVPWGDRHEAEVRFELGAGSDWDWMWTTSRPPRRPTALPAGMSLVRLDDAADAAEIADLATENPRFEGVPGQGYSERWVGVRDDAGALVACGAVQRLGSGVAHLGGILVSSRHRRRGLGALVSATLTDEVVATEGVCTLGMYSDNDAARALYRGLGYVTAKVWASRSLAHIGAAAGCH